jgi:hypothetical protein
MKAAIFQDQGDSVNKVNYNEAAKPHWNNPEFVK